MIRPGSVATGVLLFALCAPGCLRQAEDRALSDLEVGRASAGDVDWQVRDGLAMFRSADTGEIELWAQAPVLEIEADAGSAANRVWRIVVRNALPDAVLTGTAGGESLSIDAMPRPRPTVAVFEVELPPSRSARLSLAPPDAETPGRFRFAVMGDIQTGMKRVDEVFERINSEDVRFVVSTGDLVEDAEPREYVLLLEKLESLQVPYYSTIGNHELFGDPALWREHFGRFNVSFEFRGVRFSLVDSGNATIDPMVYDWLDDWMQEASGAPHAFLTHFPPLDPVGVRSGSFRSRKEASKLLSRLGRGEVDLTLYGHIHSFYRFDNAGIPARISGGGGAWAELLDDIGRHFLVVEADPSASDRAHGGFRAIDVVRVDD